MLDIDHLFLTMLSIADHIPALCRHIDQYVALPSTDRELLASMLKARRLLKRTYLLAEGEICHFENFVVEGCFRMFYVDDKGIEHTLQFAVEGWWIADLESFLKKTPSSYYIEALENSVVLQIDAESQNKLYETAPLFERYFRILHQNAYIAQSKRILENISRSGEDKYESFLQTYPQWQQRIPQKYIASYLGITPVFLSKIRKQRANRR